MRFTIRVPAVRCQGAQYYEVEAVDAAAARQKYLAGEAEFICEEIEVTEMGEPEVSEAEE